MILRLALITLLFATTPHLAFSDEGNPAETKNNTGKVLLNQVKPNLKNESKRVSEINTDSGEIFLTDSAEFLNQWTLTKYRKSREKDALHVGLEDVVINSPAFGLVFDRSDLLYLKDVKGKVSQNGDETSWEYDDERVSLKKSIKADPSVPYFYLTISGKFKKDAPKYAYVSIKGHDSDNTQESQFAKMIYFTRDGEDEEVLFSEVDSDFQNRFSENSVRWIGITSRYFLLSLIADKDATPKAYVERLANKTGRISMAYSLENTQFNIPLKLYFGAKELATISAVDPSLDVTVDYGWFPMIAYPLLWLLNKLFTIIGNYGIAIIILTVLLKIVTYPLTYKSMKSMKEMQKVQPEIAKLRDKYKDDQKKLNEEMMLLMKNRGYNPVAGCLPMLVQMPVFIALYNVLLSSVELYQAPFGLWINDLSIKDPYFITPVLMTITMFFQQKLSPNTITDPTQKKVMQFMPLMFGAFMVTLPAGLTLYMLTNILVSILQQLILNKKLDITPSAQVVVENGQ